MYRWELDGPAQQELADLPPAARASLAAFMDAVVIVDPVQYQRRRDERDDDRAGIGINGSSPCGYSAVIPAASSHT